MDITIPGWLVLLAVLVILVLFVWGMIKVSNDIDYCMRAHFRQKAEKDARFNKMERELFEMRQREIRKGGKP